MKHRPEIDGLRAVAILPVVAYHLVIVKGGFIGVDVFFVISGYLISSIIFDELRSGRFSLVRFYERRVRRIAPALCAMLLAVLALALVVMAPGDTVNVAQSAAAAVASLSNVWFWLHSGYFENPASTMPLLHTWSLGVEEQYYVVFPLLMMAWNRIRPGRLLEVILPVFAVSLWVSVEGALRHDTAAFYLLHSRAFELMLGSIAALNLVPSPEARPLREAMASVGLLAIVIPVFAYNDRIAFPGFAALVPCLGTMMVITTCRKPTMVGRLLSLPPVTFIGLISYSLYIWHWPVIILQRANWIFYTGDSKVVEKLLMLVISFGLAILSWKFIEAPFRTADWAKPRRIIFTTFAVSALVIAGLAAAIMATGGVPQFLPGRQSSYSAYIAYDPQPVLRAGTCMIDEQTTLDPSCLREQPGKPNVLLLGDSHAAHLWFGLKSVFPEVNILQVTGSSCRPTADSLSSAYDNCRVLLSEVVPRVRREHRIGLVVLAGNWVQAGAEGAVAYAAHLRAQGLPVLLVGPVPNYSRPLPRLLQLGVLTNNPRAPSRFAVAGQFEIDRTLQHEATAQGIPYISPLRLLCPRQQCRTLVGPVPLQFDSNHLTAEGSVYLARLIKSAGLLQELMAHDTRGVPPVK